MKVAIYTIALNELQFVQPWYDSAKEADYLLIADTGSTDGTIEAAQKLGINVINVLVKPWRFDMGRNASLAALPADIDQVGVKSLKKHTQKVGLVHATSTPGLGTKTEHLV
jgi:glycosyltransferase involved in cell wall biosynthesis